MKNNIRWCVSQEQVYDRLSAWKGRGLWISDLDGTIHKSMFPMLTHGYSNSDLILSFFFPLLSHPASFISFYHKALGLFIAEEVWHFKKSSQVYNKRRATKERKALDSLLIKRFTDTMLPIIPHSIMDRGLKGITKWIYPNVIETLDILSRHDFTGILISKSIQPIIDNYTSLFASHKIDCIGIGNEVSSSPRVITGEDKVNELNNIPGLLKDVDHCILIGDSREDLPFFRWGASIFGKEKSLKIAVLGEDEVLASEADIVIDDWSALVRLFYSTLPEADKDGG